MHKNRMMRADVTGLDRTHRRKLGKMLGAMLEMLYTLLHYVVDRFLDVKSIHN